MPIKTQNLVPVEPGEYEAVIIGSEITDKVFDPSRGPETVLEITAKVRMENLPEGATPVPVSCVFSPVVNGLSALSQALKRMEVAVPAGEWDEKSLIGKEIKCRVYDKDGFASLDKGSLRSA